MFNGLLILARRESSYISNTNLIPEFRKNQSPPSQLRLPFGSTCQPRLKPFHHPQLGARIETIEERTHFTERLTHRVHTCTTVKNVDKVFNLTHSINPLQAGSYRLRVHS